MDTSPNGNGNTKIRVQLAEHGSQLTHIGQLIEELKGIMGRHVEESTKYREMTVRHCAEISFIRRTLFGLIASLSSVIVGITVWVIAVFLTK